MSLQSFTNSFICALDDCLTISSRLSDVAIIFRLVFALVHDANDKLLCIDYIPREKRPC